MEYFCLLYHILLKTKLLCLLFLRWRVEKYTLRHAVWVCNVLMMFFFKLQPKMFAVPDELLTLDSSVNSLKSLLPARKSADMLICYKPFKGKGKERKNNHWVFSNQWSKQRIWYNLQMFTFISSVLKKLLCLVFFNKSE